MFSSNVNTSGPKLPTLKQWLKDNPQEELRDWAIEKVLWGEKYRSVTFFTNAFRYSIKFDTPDEYKANTCMLLDEFPMCGKHIVGDLRLFLDSESGEVKIDFAALLDNAQYPVWRQFDWGLTCDSGDRVTYKAPKPKAPKAKTPPAK